MHVLSIWCWVFLNLYVSTWSKWANKYTDIGKYYTRYDTIEKQSGNCVNEETWIHMLTSKIFFDANVVNYPSMWKSWTMKKLLSHSFKPSHHNHWSIRKKFIPKNRIVAQANRLIKTIFFLRESFWEYIQFTHTLYICIQEFFSTKKDFFRKAESPVPLKKMGTIT